MKRFAVAMLLIAACKSKAKPPADAAPVAVVDAVAAVDAAAAAAAAPPAPPPPPMPSVALVADLPTGPVRSADGRKVMWCTRGDNGMADWVETVCTIVPIGSKWLAFTVMSYADAMAIDDGADPAVDADAGVRAASARDRVTAELAKVKKEMGTDTVEMPEPIRCSFQGGAFVGRSDDPAGTSEGCDVAGVTVHVTAPGKVTVTAAGKSLLSEVLKARPRGKGDGGNECYLEASAVELSVDPDINVAAIAIAMSNPSDACALVTEYEVRAVKLP